MIEWCTKKENSQHALKTGLNWNVGEKSILAKLSQKEVLQIFDSGLPTVTLSKKYNVTASNIRLIKNGKNWSYITGKKYIKKAELDKEKKSHEQNLKE